MFIPPIWEICWCMKPWKGIKVNYIWCNWIIFISDTNSAPLESSRKRKPKQIWPFWSLLIRNSFNCFSLMSVAGGPWRNHGKNSQEKQNLPCLLWLLQTHLLKTLLQVDCFFSTRTNSSPPLLIFPFSFPTLILVTVPFSGNQNKYFLDDKYWHMVHGLRLTQHTSSGWMVLVIYCTISTALQQNPGLKSVIPPQTLMWEKARCSGSFLYISSFACWAVGKWRLHTESSVLHNCRIANDAAKGSPCQCCSGLISLISRLAFGTYGQRTLRLKTLLESFGKCERVRISGSCWSFLVD